MRGVVLAMAAAMLPGAAVAQVGPGDALDREQVERLRECLAGNVEDLSCLAAEDIPAGARTVAADIAVGGAPVPLLIEVTEAGAVDIGTVIFPWLANTNYQQALLNTEIGAVGLGQVMPSLPDTPDDATMALQEAYPGAFRSGRSWVQSVRLLEDGTQRIVALDEVNEGCRACAIVGFAVTWLDYRDGALVEARHMGWRAAALFPDEHSALQGEEALAAALLGRGYGPDEGAAFRADACLPEGDAIDAEAAAVLLSGEPLVLGGGC